MIGIQFRKSIPRYLVLKAVGPRWRCIYTSAFFPIALCELPEPRLPTSSWVRVRPILSGICGSDLAAICAKGSAYLSPLTSMPFVLGHEVVGTVTEVGSQAGGVAVGDRVVVQPALGCRVRGIEPLCSACAANQPALCRNVTRGTISAGIQTGYCHDTGGAWSQSLVAHVSQLYRVPDSMDDAVAVLTEPFACALHAALRARPGPEHTVLVIGCGSIGLLTIAALRAVHGRRDSRSPADTVAQSPPRIVALAKYPHQRKHALALGADQVLAYSTNVEQRYRQLAEALNADVYHPEIGKPTVLGGADVTYDCVASATSIDDCCRFTAAGGDMVLVGMPGIPRGIDWTTIWYKELSLHAAYAYGLETVHGQSRSTFELALEILATAGPRLRPLVGTPFPLKDYRRALDAALHAGRSRSVKTVFRIESGGG